jgi:hypothetical protein
MTERVEYVLSVEVITFVIGVIVLKKILDKNTA